MIKHILKILGIIVLILVVILVIGFIVLQVTEYRPKEREDLSYQGTPSKQLAIGDSVTILTYNVGYLSLDKTQDFFLDGGKGVMPKTDANVKRNLEGVRHIIQEQNPDICLLQEVDVKAKRSYNMNQYDQLRKDFQGTATFSLYHKCLCIPYPFPNMVGYVEAGMAVLNQYENTATRISLPSAYTFPMKAVMFKRNLLKQEIPIVNSDKKLIVINLHLEAYDDGNTRLQQLEILKKEMQAEYDKGNYVIAGGDFNQTFPTIDTTKYPVVDSRNFQAATIPQDFLPEGWHYGVDDSIPSCRLLNQPYQPESEQTQYYVLDGYLVSPNITMEEVKTIATDFEYTDHQPVVMQFKLNEI